MEICGWGRFPRVECRIGFPHDEESLRRLVTSGRSIARGNGRAYGDSALNPARTIDMNGFDRMLAFEPQTGTLTVEAGVILGDIVEAFLPRGWFPPVTPGTKFVSVGGMIARTTTGTARSAPSWSGSISWSRTAACCAARAAKTRTFSHSPSAAWGSPASSCAPRSG